MPSGLKIAVVEPTDLIGGELIKILEERDFPVKDLVLLGGKRTIGTRLEFRGEEIPVKQIEGLSFKGVEIVFFISDKAMCAEFAGRAKASGAVAIDLTSRFALQESVPLIVPEINAKKIKDHQGIIANPRSATIQLVLPLVPISRAARIKRIVVSTYQSVSDSGERALEELTSQVRDLFSFKEVFCEAYPHQIAFNALPHVGAFTQDAYTEEEHSIMAETKKIFEDQGLRICATSVRVPVFYSHGASVNFETARKISPREIREILGRSKGVQVEDEPASNTYPTPVHAVGSDECLVGRIRQDLSFENGIALWTVCDNTRKGAALNAVQIAEHLL